MSPNLVSLPLKTTEDAAWASGLKRYISRVYGQYESFEAEIARFTKLRDDTRGVAPDATGRDILYRYYGQLELIGLRIPVSETECNVKFTWYDAYSKTSTSQRSLAFEKASILFNLAAVYSHIAVDSDDFKLAYNGFQSAAGILTYISENFLHAPSTDLSQDTIKALLKLMLAQAQDSFISRLIADGKTKPLMLAKLAKSATNLYTAAHEQLLAVHTLHSWGETKWLSLASAKSKYYLALCHQLNSDHLAATGKYGHAIAALRLAQSAAKDALKVNTSLYYPNINTTVTNLSKSIDESLTVLEKDNDFVYHATIPLPTALADVPALDAAKPIPLGELYKDEEIASLIGNDLFENLIPLAVHEKSSLYSEEKAGLIRVEAERLEIAHEELASALEFLGLPVSLNEINRSLSSSSSSSTASSQVDSKVIEWAGDISANGCDISLEPLTRANRDIYNQIQRAESLLRDEAAECSKMKAHYGDRWTQSSSELFNMAFFTDLQRAKETLATASASDQKLALLAESVGSDINILAQGPHSSTLAQLYGSSHKDGVSSSSTTASKPQASLLDLDDTTLHKNDEKLKANLAKAQLIYDKLIKIQKERETVFAEFKTKLHNDDISSLLILNKNMPNSEESLFKRELAKFDPYRARIDATISHQHGLLQDLTITWRSVMDDEIVQKQRRGNEEQKSWHRTLNTRFEKAYKTWFEITVGKTKGSEFYANLSTYVTSIMTNVEKFIISRRDEGRGIYQSIKSSQVGSEQNSLRDQLSRLSFGQAESSSMPPLSSAPSLPPKPGSISSGSSEPYFTRQPSYGENGTNIYNTPSGYNPNAYQDNGFSTQSPGQPSAPGHAPAPAPGNTGSRGWENYNFNY